MALVASLACVRPVVTQSSRGGKRVSATNAACVHQVGASKLSSTRLRVSGFRGTPHTRARVPSTKATNDGAYSSSNSRYAENQPSIGDIEAFMNAAIEAEDFENAAHYRDQLATLKQSTVAEVANANESFYAAFRSGSIKKMKAIWGKGPHVQCLHPGAACIGGSDGVVQSWEIVFGSLPPGVTLEIGVEQTRVHADETMGFVTCVEKVKGDDGVGMLACTNVFEKQNGQWKIIHHHAHGINGLR